jgi:peptidoglycan/LPS O-acetylase OafA/YrhL
VETHGGRAEPPSRTDLEIDQRLEDVESVAPERDRVPQRSRLPRQAPLEQRPQQPDRREPGDTASDSRPHVPGPHRGAQDSPVVLTGHRDDIQGLRGVAVLLVVLGHAGIGFLRGGYVGVDVFFVLSGFLITGILLSRAARHGYVSLSDFYVRRARRILPAAALTLVATDIAAYHLLNFVRARQAVSDSIWASLFAANIEFARRGTDYFAQGQPPSPIQHFWSLAVEEQFYLVWPALLSLVLFGAVFGRRWGVHRQRQRQVITRGSVRRLLIVIIVAGIASLAWSIHYTKVTPDATYFSTLARAWELALGAALAIATSSLTRVPAGLRVVMGWLGVIGIVCAAVMFSGSTQFPGYAALLPTAGAALAIGAGICEPQPRLGVGRLLALPPLCYVGDRSYAFYLWHWPVLVIAVQYEGHDLSVGIKLLLVFGAFLLSIMSYAIFENPVRKMRWPTPAGALLWPASAAVVLVVAVFTLHAIDRTAARLDAASAAVQPNPLTDPSAAANAAQATSGALPAVIAAAKAAQRGAPLPKALTPPVGKLLDDIYDFPDGCVPHEGEATSKMICRLGDTTSAKTIVLMGESFAQMWMPTILRMAQRDGWVVIPLVKSACTPGSWIRFPTKPECPAWYRWALPHAKALHPDVTLIAGSWAAATNPGPAIRNIGTLSTTMKRFSKSVIVVGDAPNQSRQPVDCLLARHATMRTCTTKATNVQLDADRRIAASATKHGVGFMNTRGWFCARPVLRLGYWCPLVINRTITRRDKGHITTTYGLELADPFRAAFRRELFR